MQTTAWWRDFRYDGRALHVKKTGIVVPLERGVIGEFFTWLVFHLRVETARMGVRKDGPRIWFAPDRPRPWYFIWPAVQLSGLRLAASPQDADVGFFFEDKTQSAPPAAPEGLALINFACPDVTKSRVAAIYERVFGRALAVDPAAYAGEMVEKSEKNGAHDGRIVRGPIAPAPGKVYQRLIDTLALDGCVEDLRCPTVGGEIPVVFMKRRPVEKRFENANTEVRMMEPGEAFSALELDRLRAFAQAMGLEWGGIDVLRDRRDGALWIVDVNKTDMGPPIALSLKQKMAATRQLGAALRAYVERRAGETAAARLTDR